MLRQKNLANVLECLTFEIFGKIIWAVQRRKLKDFELYLSPALWQQAQTMVQAGQVKGLREVEKHFWVASVADGENNYETEAIITPQSVKAFTCECWDEGRRRMCVHVAAALLRLRQFLSQKVAPAPAPKAKTAATASVPRFTVTALIEQVEGNDLRQFIRDYARENPDFSVAMKLWFAGTTPNQQAAFDQVLASLLPQTVSNRDADTRRLRRHLPQLHRQLQQAAGERHFIEAAPLALAILEKLSPWVARSEGEVRQSLLSICQKALQTLGEMLATPDALAPALRQSVWTSVLGWAANDWSVPEWERDLVRLLASSALDAARFSALLEAYQQRAQPSLTLLTALTAAYAQRGLPEGARRLLDDWRGQPTVVRKVIDALYHLGYYPAVLLLVEQFLEVVAFEPNVRRALEDVALSVAERTADRDRQIRYLRDRFLQSGSLVFFQRLKNVAAEKWPDVYETLRTQLEQQGKVEPLAAVLAAENDRPRLAEWLSEASLSVLENYAVYLDDTFLQSRYESGLIAHLQAHVGPVASGVVREALEGLLRQGRLPLVAALVSRLLAAFPERHTLPEELQNILPVVRK